MTFEYFIVTTYQSYNYSSRGKGADTNILILRGVDDGVCVVYFKEDDSATLPKAKRNRENNFYFYYRHNQLQHLIDLLRNEKPIFAVFHEEGAINNSYISTALEPVGEGEES